jgi:hypothetical protein
VIPTGILTLCRRERAGVARLLRALDCVAVFEVVVIRLIGNCDSAHGPNAMTLKIVSKGTLARTMAQGKEPKECEQSNLRQRLRGRGRAVLAHDP